MTDHALVIVDPKHAKCTGCKWELRASKPVTEKFMRENHKVHTGGVR